jgi:hypothetical protein
MSVWNTLCSVHREGGGMKEGAEKGFLPDYEGRFSSQWWDTDDKWKSKGVMKTIFLIHIDYDKVKTWGLVQLIISSATTHVKKFFLADEKGSYICYFHVFSHFNLLHSD